MCWALFRPVDSCNTIWSFRITCMDKLPHIWHIMTSSTRNLSCSQILITRDLSLLWWMVSSNLLVCFHCKMEIKFQKWLNWGYLRLLLFHFKGLKPGQRKVLFTCFKRNDKREVKVAQLAGSVAEMSSYHHGEVNTQSMFPESIISEIPAESFSKQIWWKYKVIYS